MPDPNLASYDLTPHFLFCFDGVKSALEANTQSTILGAVVLGALFHQAIRPFEIDRFMYHLIALGVTGYGGLVALYATVAGLDLVGSLTKASVVSFSFNTALFVSIGIYRLLFHRLRRFPGPLGAKVTRLYISKLVAKKVQYYKEIEKMHEEYGDFIRTGPRELCIVRSSAVPLIYGPNSGCRKSTWYDQSSINQEKCSVHMSRDFDGHRRRRRAWDRSFSIKALATYTPRIKSKTDLFMAQIEKRIGQPMDATDWSMFFSFDVMGEVGFGKDFDNMDSGTEHPAIAAIHTHMKMLGILSTAPWLLNLLSSIPGATSDYSNFFDWCTGQIKEKQGRIDPEKYPEDIVSWLLKAYREKDISAPPSEEALHDDSRVVVVAGSETTASTLTTILFYFVKYPHVPQKLRRLLDEAMPDGVKQWTYEKAKDVTYLDDIINEALRLKPALLTGGYRVTPSTGLEIDGQFIPGDVNVWVPTQLIQTDPRYFPQANEFIPERWGERKKEMGTDNAPFFPFSIGAYSCPGKNLAYLTLRIALSHIAMLYDVSFAPGETGKTFDEEALDTFTTTLPPLKCQFSPRSM